MKKFKNDFEKENYFEINDSNCSVSKIKEYGIKDDYLACEVYLREIYGDVINDESEDDYDSSTKKQVIKLSDVEKGKNQEYLRVCDEIDNSEFDDTLETLKF
jgi:hypothetical protein